MALGGRELRVVLTSEVDKFRKGMRSAEDSTKSFASRSIQNFKRVGIAAGVLAGALAALAVKMGVDAVKAAVQDQSTQAALARQMKATTKATDAQVAAMEDYIDAAQKRTGLDDGDMRKGLARLLRSTKDATRAQSLMNTAIKLSLATGKPLVQVTEALAKANDGNTNALKRIGVSLGPAAKGYGEMAKQVIAVQKAQDKAKITLEQYGPASDEYKRAVKKVRDETAKLKELKHGTRWVKELNQQFSGAEATDAATYAGKVRRLATAGDELQEAFGKGILDGLAGTADGVGDITDELYDMQVQAELTGKMLGGMLSSFVDGIGSFEVGAIKVANMLADIYDTIQLMDVGFSDFLGTVSDSDAQAIRDTINAGKKRRDDALLQAAWELQGHTGPAPGTGATGSKGSGSGRGGSAGGGSGGGGGWQGDTGGASWGSKPAGQVAPNATGYPQWNTGFDPTRYITQQRHNQNRADSRSAQKAARTNTRP